MDDSLEPGFTATGDMDGRWPLVIASPHSGRYYPAAFLASAHLPLPQLRRAEDVLVDQLLAGISGVPVLCARYGRAFLDLNRAADELDPRMFEGPLGVPARNSDRVEAGLGVVPRVVGLGLDIYRNKLPAAEAARRIAALHMPWHDRLATQLARAREQHGYAILLDCHSMPRPAGIMPPQIVIGDRQGRSASPALVTLIERHFAGAGWRVARNNPYAGGYTTVHHGQPAVAVHCIQIEVDRTLYMDSGRLVPGPGFDRMARHFQALVQVILAAAPLLGLGSPFSEAAE
ncbi:N-formylglutamate amidohydrolase [Polymorphobacter sp.]|uniref:N-formylglutamate amidohydrolase n=1 Tax=Polymorphobacter sp. TaxID=1909290 RepID=UPI003F6FA1C7